MAFRGVLQDPRFMDRRVPNSLARKPGWKKPRIEWPAFAFADAFGRCLLTILRSYNSIPQPTSAFSHERRKTILPSFLQQNSHFASSVRTELIERQQSHACWRVVKYVISSTILLQKLSWWTSTASCRCVLFRRFDSISAEACTSRLHWWSYLAWVFAKKLNYDLMVSLLMVGGFCLLLSAGPLWHCDSYLSI